MTTFTGTDHPTRQRITLRQEYQPISTRRKQGGGNDWLGIPADHRREGGGLSQQRSGVRAVVGINAETQLSTRCGNVVTQALDRGALR